MQLQKISQLTLTLIFNSLFLFSLSAIANTTEVAEKLGECTAA